MSRKSNPFTREAGACSARETISSRRDLLKLGALAGVSSLMGACAAFSEGGPGKEGTAGTSASGGMSSSSGLMTKGWDDYPAILARIKAPGFPARDFTITQYGAVADGQTEATAAIAKAIEACRAAGGGRWSCRQVPSLPAPSCSRAT